MPNTCTENQLVEHPAIGLFAEPGWKTVAAMADLAARAAGTKAQHPAEANRTYEIVAKEFRQSPTGGTKGWRLKVFP